MVVRKWCFIWCKNFSRNIKFILIILTYKIGSARISFQNSWFLFSKKTLKESYLLCASECSRKMTYSMGPIYRKMINLVTLILWHISLENLSFIMSLKEKYILLYASECSSRKMAYSTGPHLQTTLKIKCWKMMMLECLQANMPFNIQGCRSRVGRVSICTFWWNKGIQNYIIVGQRFPIY